MGAGRHLRRLTMKIKCWFWVPPLQLEQSEGPGASGNALLRATSGSANYGHNFNSPFSATRRVETWRDENLRPLTARPGASADKHHPLRDCACLQRTISSCSELGPVDDPGGVAALGSNQDHRGRRWFIRSHTRCHSELS